ncbi:AAA family ATPase [Heliorestis acidaminivorans]|uniref:AAA family ATPase n=1 Tax=Heliorestis acidaminivorans TaxID=553427 RepID=A0A6I0EN76_9FIRM|nr:AAA family ATPase [Heliorestis acidaminivorans]KAB2951080.1 AAA family ATPase [Heliorestis acidaminivorans]
MKLDIKYCNSIDSGSIQIKENCLNIKYAINGTGKTTLANAVVAKISDSTSSSDTLLQLKPFKYRNHKEFNPEIEGLNNINKISIFNENYVNQYVFLQDELVKNSFEIFIKTDKYEEGIKQINELISAIRLTFVNSQEIDLLINDLTEYIDCFGKAKTGYSAAGSLGKGIGKGNKVENIPENLKVYEEYIKHDSNVKWLKWQMTGNEYIDISENCPYCTSGISGKKETILAVSKEYDSKVIEHLNKVIGVLQRLSFYFTDKTNENIKEIIKNVNGLKPEQISYLLEIKQQTEDLRQKLYDIKTIGFKTLKDVNKVIELISKYKIDLKYYSHLNTTSTEQKINSINSSLDDVLAKAGKLQGEVNKQKKHIEETIKIYKNEINSFLKYAGYSYQVDLTEEQNGTYKLKLKHNDYLENIDNVKVHLSYGERNAFALVLFMFETIKSDPDLIILDDPISSFDKNKKFAIINMLFRGQRSLRNKTVIMLTHDFEPVIDMIYNLPHKFNPVPNAFFLENIDGVLTEKEILKTDIKTFLDITKENIVILDEDINKIVYLRRLFEINKQKNEAYQLISNLLHKREVPLYKENGAERQMTTDEIHNAIIQIKEWIPEFVDYKTYFDQVNDIKNLIRLYKKSQNNYEKLQIYRIIDNSNHENDIIKKFVNEAFHIENDYLFQLNPCKYQLVPRYIINECDKDIENIEKNIEMAVPA